MENNNFSVYCHISPSGKRYFGITSQKPEKRWNQGKNYAGPAFKNAIEKYGWDSFEHIIIDSGLTKEEAFQKEIDLISEFKTTDSRYGYNITPGGEYHEMSEAGKKNVAEGLRRYYENPDAHKRASDARKKYYSEHPEAIEALRNQRTGAKASAEAKAKMSAARKGRTVSLETRKRLSESKQGWSPPPETRANMCEAAKKRAEKRKPEIDEILRENAKAKRKAVIATKKESGEKTKFESVLHASTTLGIKTPHISRCLNGRRPSAGGYYWSYADGGD